MISTFQGEYRFLSNFWIVPGGVSFEGISFPSVEHAYQAAKASSTEERLWVRNAKSPGQAKKRGRQIAVRDNWDSIKMDVMLELVRKKFQEPELRRKLLATMNHHLEEGNTWGDKFWGVCDGVGENNLGKILMQVREEIRQSNSSQE